jgi:hypothetical protein
MTTMTMRVQVRDNHYVLLGANGDELMTSKEYADHAGAKRSAQNFFDNLQTSDMVLELGKQEGKGKSAKWVRDEVLQEITVDEVSEVVVDSHSGPARKLSVPEPGKSLHAQSPYAQ